MIYQLSDGKFGPGFSKGDYLSYADDNNFSSEDQGRQVHGQQHGWSDGYNSGLLDRRAPGPATEHELCIQHTVGAAEQAYHWRGCLDAGVARLCGIFRSASELTTKFCLL